MQQYTFLLLSTVCLILSTVCLILKRLHHLTVLTLTCKGVQADLTRLKKYQRREIRL
jgi:hypothetical protein